MDKNSINNSPEIVGRAPSTRREKREGGSSTMEYFRGKSGQKGSHKGGKNNKIVKKRLSKNNKDENKLDNVEKPKKEKVDKKTTRLDWLKEYINFVHSNSVSPVIKQVLFHAGITPDICTYSDHLDHHEEEVNRKYDPRYNEDIRVL